MREMDSNISLCYTTIMNKPVIFKFTTQKEKHNTYLYFANDKQFPYTVYATAFEIVIDIPEELVINFAIFFSCHRGKCKRSLTRFHFRYLETKLSHEKLG